MIKIDPNVRLQLKVYKRKINRLRKKRDRLWWKNARDVPWWRKIIFDLLGV